MHNINITMKTTTTTMSAHYKPYKNDPDTEHLDWAEHDVVGTIEPRVRSNGAVRVRSRRCRVIDLFSPRATFGAAAVLLVLIVLAFFVGFFSADRASGTVPAPAPPGQSSANVYDSYDEDESIRERILETISKDNIESNLRKFSRTPHLAGTPADLSQAEEIATAWRSYGLDRVDMASYNVLLSYPDPDQPGIVRVNNDAGREVFRSRPREVDAPDVVSAYGAYSPAGIVTGDIVYCNYGLLNDFAFLTDKLKMNLTGKIILMRLGMLFMGEQVKNAEAHNAAGVLLYPDPQDFIPPSFRNFVYPTTWWLPSNAIPRGTAINPPDGDPLTPGYPATDFASRLSPEEAPGLPHIPVHVVSYGDAYTLVSLLGGKKAQPTWQGGFNVSYNVGPGFAMKNWTVQMEVHTSNQMRRTYNVIGYIKGRLEPDRYVLIGNHRDAWIYGAADPSSGTAVLLELARTYGLLLKQGWRPRRTLVFCSWGAEEFNLIGSTEWLEEHIKVLQQRAVAYINIDVVVTGNHSLTVSASPLLYKPVFDSTAKIPNPNPSEADAGRGTLYDTWTKAYPNNRNTTAYFLYPLLGTLGVASGGSGGASAGYRIPRSCFLKEALEGVRPRVRKLHSNTDYSPFFNRAGIPSVELSYAYIYPSAYPLYHTAFDNFRTIETFVDPTFKYHKAVCQTLGELIRDISDSVFLPFNAFYYAQVMKDLLQSLQLHFDLMPQFRKDLKAHKIEIEWLDTAVDNFSRAVLDFHLRQEKVDKNNILDVRRINDQLMLLERAFLDPQGLPGQPLNRHIVLGPARARTFGDDSFPGLVDLFANISQYSDPQQRWTAMRQHLSILVFTIQAAANTLSEMM